MLHIRQMSASIIAPTLAAVLTACSGFGEVVAPPNAETEQPGNLVDLDGTKWVLISLNGNSLIEGSNITLNFTEGQVSGFAGCNTYHTAYTSDGPSLTLETLAATEIACCDPAGIMEQEQRYLGFLKDVTIYRIYGSQLWLETDDGRALVLNAQE